jgi:hypothetical protein
MPQASPRSQAKSTPASASRLGRRPTRQPAERHREALMLPEAVSLVKTAGDDSRHRGGERFGDVAGH